MPHMKLSPITGHLLTIHADAVNAITYNILEPAAPKTLILVVLSMMYPSSLSSSLCKHLHIISAIRCGICHIVGGKGYFFSEYFLI